MSNLLPKCGIQELSDDLASKSFSTSCFSAFLHEVYPIESLVHAWYFATRGDEKVFLDLLRVVYWFWKIQFNKRKIYIYLIQSICDMGDCTRKWKPKETVRPDSISSGFDECRQPWEKYDSQGECGRFGEGCVWGVGRRGRYISQYLCAGLFLASIFLPRSGCFFPLGIGKASLIEGFYGLCQEKRRGLGGKDADLHLLFSQTLWA